MFRRSGAFPGTGVGGSKSSGSGGGGFGPMSSLFDVTRANYKVINKGEKVKTKFNDVAGLDNAKEEVSEFVHFLRDPSAYTKLGIFTFKNICFYNNLYIYTLLFVIYYLYYIVKVQEYQKVHYYQDLQDVVKHY